MPGSELTREAVLKAVAEYDHLGQEEFLSKYRFGPAKEYFLLHDNKRYDSKAIFGVARKYEPHGEPWTTDDFSGGEVQVARKLEALGFTVTRPSKRIDWITDELILALDIYFSADAPPGKTSKRVAEVSDILKHLSQRLGIDLPENHRNINSVYLKIENFKRFDSRFSGSGRVGMPRGNKLEKVVWNEFALDRERLAQVAALIRSTVQNDSLWQSAVDADEDDIEAPEGKIITRLHRSRERSRKLVERKKQAARTKHGKLECEACSFDFHARYGDRGHGFIEAHHTKPVHTLQEGEKTKASDFALVCANCHRMIHSQRPWLSIEEVQVLLLP